VQGGGGTGQGAVFGHAQKRAQLFEGDGCGKHFLDFS
jgi:hypothetical protein